MTRSWLSAVECSLSIASPDDRQSSFPELEHDPKCAVAANRDERVEAIRPERLEQLLRAIALFPRPVWALDAPFQRIAAIRCAEDRAAEMRDAADFTGAERHELGFPKEAAESPPNAETLPAAVHRREHCRANDGVESRGVAAAGGNRKSHFLPAIASRMRRITSPGSAWRLDVFLENTRFPSTPTSKTPPDDCISLISAWG